MERLRTERNRNIVQGAIGLIILVSLITVGIKASFGAFDGGYEVHGSFAAAGQGLLSGSDVKVRGVNVGEVSTIELVDNKALITLRINDGTTVPTSAQAVIRPKTLFGEKFIDIIPGEAEETGPFLADGGELTDTLGGFELERVLSDAYPVLQAIDPIELATVLDGLANAGDGLGETINRSIVNGADLADLASSNDAEFRQFTSDLALLSEELDKFAPALVAGARDLNVALPSLNARSAQLNEVLIQGSRLATSLADLLESNQEFTTNALTNGSRALQTLYDNRAQIQPLLVGVTQYTRTIAEAIRFEVGDGTMMAAVKNLVHAPVAPPALPGSADGTGAGGSLLGPLSDLGLPGADAGGATVDHILDLLSGGER